MAQQLTRRKLLAATAAAGTVGLAGCLGTRDGPVPEPAITDDRIDDGWRLVDETSGEVFENDVGPITLRALQHTLLYEHVGVAEAVADAFDAQGSPVIVFASRIDLRPAIDSLPLGVGRAEVMEEVNAAAADAFRQQLQNAGIENVEQEDSSTIEIDSGHTADLREFTGDFAVDTEVEIRDGVTETISDAIDVRGKLAVWHDGTDALLSGGVYPADPVDGVFEDAIGSQSIDLADVVGAETAETLSTDPAAFEEDVTALMKSVE